MAVVERTKVHAGTAEFQDVSEFFESRNVVHGKKLQVVSIERVHNGALEQRFKDKTQEYKQTFGQVRIVRAWHGTKKLNVAPILRNNFDVTKHGQSVGHRFGAGVSFSSMSGYASNYCDKTHSACMLLANVLVSNVVEVPENTGSRVPREPPFLPGRYPLRYDTTAKNKDTMDVFVKFDKDSFLPTHVVNFRRCAAPILYSYEEEDEEDDDDKSVTDTDSDYQVDDNFDDYNAFYGFGAADDEDD
ncbi:protein mono-ADP-ribosyltransferase PARP10-like [Thrips palmi]|uniref:Poly [ADP-ribose] polymerase n=1 Tax=Thrips palmi TaxID=161013 RepID=A0A6P9ADP7_THRPL|nr:protein mono-ADP-ribosyltransferase PARP10-like [Thrips palmi]